MSTVRVLIARGWCRQPIPHSRCIGRHYGSLQFQVTWALNVCPPYVGSDRIHLTVWVSRSLVSLIHCPLSMPAICCPPCLPRPTGCLPVGFSFTSTPAMLLLCDLLWVLNDATARQRNGNGNGNGTVESKRNGMGWNDTRNERQSCSC